MTCVFILKSFAANLEAKRFLDKSYGIKVAWYGHFDKKLPIFKSVKMFESRPATTTCRQVLLLEKCSQTNVVECVYLLKKVVSS